MSVDSLPALKDLPRATSLPQLTQILSRPRAGTRGEQQHVGQQDLAGTKVLIAARMGARSGHFMPTSLLDTQFVTSHLESLGAIEISRRQYHRQLEQALDVEGDFYFWPAALPVAGAVALQSVSQTS